MNETKKKVSTWKKVKEGAKATCSSRHPSHHNLYIIKACRYGTLVTRHLPEAL
jgi:hypothetical protein